MEENLKQVKEFVGKNAKNVNIAFVAILAFLYFVGPILSINLGFSRAASSVGISAIRLVTEMSNLIKLAGFAGGGAAFGMIVFLILIIAVLVLLILSVINIVKDKVLGKFPLYICGAYLVSFLLLAIFAKQGGAFGFLGGWLPMIIAGAWAYVQKLQSDYAAGK